MANCSAKCKLCTGNTSPGRKQSGCQGELFLKGPNAPVRSDLSKISMTKDSVKDQHTGSKKGEGELVKTRECDGFLLYTDV